MNFRKSVYWIRCYLLGQEMWSSKVSFTKHEWSHISLCFASSVKKSDFIMKSVRVTNSYSSISITWELLYINWKECQYWLLISSFACLDPSTGIYTFLSEHSLLKDHLRRLSSQHNLFVTSYNPRPRRSTQDLLQPKRPSLNNELSCCWIPYVRCGLLTIKTEQSPNDWMQTGLELNFQVREDRLLQVLSSTSSLLIIKNVSVKSAFWSPEGISNVSKDWRMWMLLVIVS